MGPSSLDKESKSSFSRKQHIPQTDQHRQTSNVDNIMISHFRHDNTSDKNSKKSVSKNYVPMHQRVESSKNNHNQNKPIPRTNNDSPSPQPRHLSQAFGSKKFMKYQNVDTSSPISQKYIKPLEGVRSTSKIKGDDSAS